MRRTLASLLALSCVAQFSPAAAQDLPTAIADALEHAPAMAEAAAAEAAAKARLDRAKAERSPLLRVEGSAGVGRIDNGGFFGITADNTTPFALQATGEMPLWTGGRTGAAIAQAQGGLGVAREQREMTRLQTVLNAVSAYTAVLSSRQLEERFGKTVAALTEVERQAGLRFRVGEIARSDLAQARARKAEAEAGLAQAQGQRIAAEARLARITGKPVAALADLPAPPAVPASLDEALAAARGANPMLKQAHESVAMAKAGTRAARAEGMPVVGLFSEAAHVRDQFFPGYKADSIAVGVRGRWTLWSGGRVAAQSRAADADLTASEARLRGADEELQGMVIEAWQGYRTASEMADASALQSLAAEQALSDRKLEARVGSVPQLAVLDAEREASSAAAARITAEGQRLVAAWRLNALTGSIQP